MVKTTNKDGTRTPLILIFCLASPLNQILKVIYTNYNLLIDRMIFVNIRSKHSFDIIVDTENN